MKRIRADYHPGNLTSFSPYRQDNEPPFSYRSVDTTPRPVLYDHDERPIYRRVGFTLREAKPCR